MKVSITAASNAKVDKQASVAKDATEQLQAYEEALEQAMLFIEPIAEWERKNGSIMPNYGCEEIIEVIFDNGMIINPPRSSRYTSSVISQVLNRFKQTNQQDEE